MKPQRIDLAKLKTDGGTQAREAISNETVREYMLAMEAGDSFPPIDVFYDGASYWIADGFHRFYGARDAKKKDIPCIVHNGTVRDAILFAVGANRTNGLRRTNADKRRAVLILLEDEEWVQWSDNAIAEQAGVHHSTVADIRRTLVADSATSLAAKQADKPRIGKDGKKQSATKPKKEPVPGPCPRGGEHKANPEDEDGACYCGEPAEFFGLKEEPKAAQQQDTGFDADAWNSSIESFCRGVQAEFAKHPSGEWLDENRIGIAQGQIRSALSTLRQAKVHGKCPHCGGKGCKSCRQTGWMPKTEYESHGGK